MNIKKVIVGELETNCYIVEQSNNCLIIDPGGDFDMIRNHIDKNVVGVLITHTHFDHIGALEDVLSYYKVNFYDKSNLVEGMNTVNDFKFEVIFNPGHTLDSISFIFGDCMFSGDFIFEGTIGRCDIGGSFNMMKDSIKKILNSKINYKIYPGHGNSTILDDERNMLKNHLYN